MMRILRSTKALYLGLLLLVSLGTTIGLNLAAPKATALSGSQFQAGRIIDDSVFYKAGAMTSEEIQAFLNAKVPSCDTNGTQASSHWYSGGNRYYTRAEWGAQSGNPAPYTCLRNFSESTPSKGADAYCAAYSGGTKSAAQIINDVGRACSISQKTLLVLLQKEQSLVTDDWPWSIQYRAATGYGCPDTAACDSEYYGFFNQVYNAARQFQRYSRQAHLFNYRSGVTSYIQYNPNAGCGGSNVYLENSATAGLYNYTPYQPNASALNNLYGSGDGCGAYGNRNFWRMFIDWFGSTRGFDYDWSFEDISISTGSSVVPALEPTTVTITARNRGNQSWSKTNFPVRLATANPTNHNSALYDPGWVSAFRPAVMNEDVVLPGENGTFTFTINPPNRAGSYYEDFNLVAEGATWFNSTPYTLHIVITPKTYTWQMVSQTSSTGSFEMLPGSTGNFTLVAKNTGNVTWSNTTNPVRLGTWMPTNRTSPFQNGWSNPARPATLQETSVAPGQNGTFVFSVRAPSNEGWYSERFNLVSDGKTWMEDPWMEFNVNVRRRLTWQMVSQTSSTGSFDIAQGATGTFTLVAKNTGNTTWSNTTNPVRLGAWNPTNRTSAFINGWSNPARPATLQETSVAPGQNGTFVFSIKAPSRAGFYVERFNLAMDGVAWMEDPWMEFNIHVL